MSILSNDALNRLLQCVCDDRRSPWFLSVMNICSPIPKHCAPFSDTGRVHNMFAIDRNKSSVNFTGSNVFRLQKPNHGSHLTVGGIWYRRVHCHNPSHSQREKVRWTNCNRKLSTLYWTHRMTDLVQWNNCAGCMRKRSLLSVQTSYNAVNSSSRTSYEVKKMHVISILKENIMYNYFWNKKKKRSLRRHQIRHSFSQ